MLSHKVHISQTLYEDSEKNCDYILGLLSHLKAKPSSNDCLSTMSEILSQKLFVDFSSRILDISFQFLLYSCQSCDPGSLRARAKVRDNNG